MCHGKTQNGALFCSEDCEERHYDYVDINILSLWIDRTLSKMNCYERYIEVVKFSKRHNMDMTLVEIKIERKYFLKICKGKI